MPALLLAGIAQAAVQYVQIPAGQDHTTITDVGGVPVQPFDLAPQAAITDGMTGITTIPGVPASVTSSLTVAPGVQKYTVPGGGWRSAWANGYTGPVFYVASQTAILTLPPRTTAFHVFVQPAITGTFDISATTDSGVTSGAVAVTTVDAPTINSTPGFGFSTTTPGEFIRTVTINASTGVGFAIGLFGMAQAPAAPASNVAAVPVLGGWGLGLLGALVAGLGLMQRRRRA